MAEVFASPRRHAGVAIVAQRISPTLAAQLNAGRADDPTARCWYPYEAGEFSALFIHGEGYMNDSRGERDSCLPVVAHARGRVLIVGLGIGMILHPILANPAVTHVRVLERERGVIELVRPTLRHVPGAEKLIIEEAEITRDVHGWQPPRAERYDTIWVDFISGFGWSLEWLTFMESWIYWFGRWRAPGGWVGHWAQREVATYLLGAPDRHHNGWGLHPAEPR